MRLPARLALIALAALLALGSWAPAARAAGDPAAARRAAGYVAAQAAGTGEVGAALDSLLALAAAQDATLAPQAGVLLDTVRAGAAAYAATPEAAARAVVVASALGLDPARLGGTDVVAAVEAGVRADGSFGASPGPASSAWGLLALTRAGRPLPPALLRALVSAANPDGGYPASAGQPSDPLTTGLVLQALASQADSLSARDAAARAAAWGQGSLPDGVWPGSGYQAARSTITLATGLQAAGSPQPRAVAFTAGLLGADGAVVLDGRPSLELTQAAALLLGDTSLATVSAPGLAGGSPAPATPSGSASPEATPSATAAPAPAASESAPATTASPAPPSPAGPATDDGTSPLWVFLPIVLIALLAGAAYLVYGRRPPSDDDPPPEPPFRWSKPKRDAEAPPPPDQGPGPSEGTPPAP